MITVQHLIKLKELKVYEAVLPEMETNLEFKIANAMRLLKLNWYTLKENDHLVGVSIANSQLRTHTNCSIVVIPRSEELIPNPSASFELAVDDMFGLTALNERIRKL